MHRHPTQCTTLLQGYERVIKPTLLGIANVLGAVNRTPSVEKGEGFFLPFFTIFCVP